MTTRRLFQTGGCIVMAGAAALLHASMQMPYMTSLGPGPGFFPYWLSMILLLLGAVMLIQAFTESPRALPEDFWPAEGGFRRVLVVLGAVALAAAGLNQAGFGPTMLVVNLMLLLALGVRKPLPLLATALAGSFGVYFVFTHWLGVQLPAGTLFN
ncbi:tripartite tricarboxylate transporter TctB family protein [Bosea beijingensis]|uniref:tripartite tricarboxylate transporter TctB family protein n=1 Tax=Bosea beijingensis TaxID=3068632 RepID=UPI0027426E52|nr:tripartite tricarboxylate transporter TctB family protein [Bosea sp. REN20]